MKFQVCALGDVTNNFDTKRVPIKESDRVKGQFPYYGASGIVDYVSEFIFDGEYLLIAEDGENLRTRQTPIAFRARGKFWVNNHAHVVTGNDKALTRYLEYAINLADINSYLSGSTMPKLTQGNLNRLPVIVPPVPVQKEIVKIIGAIDDKIELNCRLNQSLESIAKTIFKEWFVDFGPVKAKVEGNLSFGIDAAAASLLPDSFENSDIGQIPRGWKVRPIYELAEWQNGMATKSNHFSVLGLPIIKIAELKSGIDSQTKLSDQDHDEKYKINDKCILFSWSGSPDTSIDTFIWDKGYAWLNQHIFKVTPKGLPDTFVYYALKQLKPVFIEVARNKQTTGLGHVTVADLKRMLHIYPPAEVVKQFDAVIKPLFDNYFSNLKENQYLTATRSLLLPRLISGDVQPWVN